MESLSFGQKVHNYARTHTLRRLFVYTWLLGNAVGLILSTLFYGVEVNVFTQMQWYLFGFAGYYAATILHGIEDYGKAKKIIVLHFSTLATFLFFMLIFAYTDEGANSIFGFSDEEADAIQLMKFGMEYYQNSFGNKILLYAVLGVLIYNLYQGYSSVEARYRYIPLTLAISYICLLAFCLNAQDYLNLYVSTSDYLFIAAFLFIPVLMSIVVLVKEGNASIASANIETKAEDTKEEVHHEETAATLQQTDDKYKMLIQLKELLDAGILTQEEVDAKKAKILGTAEHQESENEEQIHIPEDLENEVAEKNEEVPQPTPYTNPYAMPPMMSVQIQPKSPQDEQSLTSEDNLIDDEEDNNDHTNRWIVAIIVVGLLALLLICYSQCGRSTDTNPNEYDVCDTAYADSAEVYEEESDFGDEYSTVVDDDDIICSAIMNYLRGDEDAVFFTRSARYSLSESSWPEVYCTDCGYFDSPASYKDLSVVKVGEGQYKYKCVCPNHGTRFVDCCTIHAFLDTDGVVKIERITWDDVVDAPL